MLQPTPSPHRTSLIVLAAVLGLGLVGMVASPSTGGPSWHIGRIVSFAASALSAILLLGIGLLAWGQSRQLAAMRDGDVLGSWRAPDGTPIDVGRHLAVVGGEVRPWSSGFHSLKRTFLNRQAGHLEIHGTFSDGNVERAFVVLLPFPPDAATQAVACGEQLAAHHNATFDSDA